MPPSPKMSKMNVSEKSCPTRYFHLKKEKMVFKQREGEGLEEKQWKAERTNKWGTWGQVGTKGPKSTGKGSCKKKEGKGQAEGQAHKERPPSISLPVIRSQQGRGRVGEGGRLGRGGPLPWPGQAPKVSPPVPSCRHGHVVSHIIEGLKQEGGR